MSLHDRVALVTGAGRGIGRAIADRLADGGCRVVVADVDGASAEQAAAEIGVAYETETLGVGANVADATSVKQMVEAAVAAFGSVDILVNNAGITRDGLLLRMKEADWDQVLAVNLKGAFLCTQQAARLMAKGRWGRIVNIASIVGAMGNIGQANYVAAKAGLIGLTKTVAREYASRGITCNAVAPGFIDTAMTQALTEEIRAALLAQIPMQRLGSPEDVATTVAFLASEAAGYVTGQVVHVNGGMYM
ncbi:MAG: 3-oxoacyl-ACP reductase [Nitrospirae bacterium CG18_big_fil_WC_8_21_14_2_50_70_55]|nr:3-oxoacyl-[acyl-carrier-protein] reductase [Deltaproteobacteria bacterium]OIP67828.1 MAG: 3-oxoacyl-[acyl-carrier-protein] reductase [Nitrospirae bacterium CG2_30_70_394]PIQ07067.1 MAG: 3-oxoacyl-ACP reductase [Nitrospirae bacterium CG18_big_fil_WC_8_21_14_2_50_70_55]PIU78878.1 MAG: 3-oxoacyl-ACP reductase [Nitrospirae bacterium CG06_land_8_20_14_3_00_70_43]PIW82371.1 MAG: 3-oxoacyl-ACP reductase [Nitrospirae bacterium CG_4_8_14_3_um_filter_70_85]PIX82381.1 MAG: 3-oxoacyl-ACP reductase [Nit